MLLNQWLARLAKSFQEGWSDAANSSDTPSLRIDTQVAYTYAIYPFLHALEGKDRARRLQQLQERWQHAWLRLPDKELREVWDDTRFVVPPLRRVLFPETALLSQAVSENSLVFEEVRQHLKAPLPDLDLRLVTPYESVRRLTFQADALSAYHQVAIAGWKLREDASRWDWSVPFPVHIEQIRVWLFPQRVGFLVLKLRLQMENPPVDQYVEWLYYLGQVLPRTSSWILPRWQFGNEALEARVFLDRLLAGLIDPDDSETHEFGQAYGRSFHLYNYASLTQATAPLADAPDAPFGTQFRRALYELATCTLTKDPNYVPSAETLQAMLQQNWLALWANWEALALQDHVFYLAKNHLGFLGRNVENDYLNLYLLTLYQKTRLRLLAGELQILQAEARPPLDKAKRLRQQFVEFRNHYWFEEASIRPQGNNVYRRYQQGLEVRPLYEEVKTELDELEEYYREQTSKRIASAINVLTFLGVPVGIAAELFGDLLKPPMRLGAFSAFVLAATGVGLYLQREWLGYRWRSFRAWWAARSRKRLSQEPRSKSLPPAQEHTEGTPHSGSK